MPAQRLDWIIAEVRVQRLAADARNDRERAIAARVKALLDEGYRTKRIAGEPLDPENLFFQAWAAARAETPNI
jgi:hypothetical protein